MTDNGTVLHGAIHPRKHDQIHHSNEEYSRYEKGVCISTNTVEEFFSLLKRASTEPTAMSANSTCTVTCPSLISGTTHGRLQTVSDL